MDGGAIDLFYAPRTCASSIEANNSKAVMEEEKPVSSREMARPTRFERVASTFGGWRSIQLSYGRISVAYAVLTWTSCEPEATGTDLASPCFPILF